MALPPSDAGGAKERVSSAFPAEIAVMDGAPGRVAGVAVTEAEGWLEPMALRAVTEQL
ncbi:hypothetical protein D3C71_1992220 [compost metagenome]